MAERLLATLRNAHLILEYATTQSVRTRQVLLPLNLSTAGLIPDRAVAVGRDGGFVQYAWDEPVIRPLAYRVETRDNPKYEHGVVEFRDSLGLRQTEDQTRGGRFRRALTQSEQLRGMPQQWQFGWSIKRRHNSVVLFNEVVGNNNSAALSLTIVEPTENNQMICHGSCWFSDSDTTVSITTPASFTQDKWLRYAGFGASSHISSKVAGASEGTTVTQTWANQPGGMANLLWYGEISGLVSGSHPADQSAGSIYVPSNVSLKSSGTTPALSQTSSFAVAGFMTNLQATGRSFTNGFDEQSYLDTGSGNTSQVVATKEVTGTAGVETTYDWTSADQLAQGLIVVYAVAAEVPPTPTIVSPPGAMEIYEGDTITLEGAATGGLAPYSGWAWMVQEGGSGTVPVLAQQATMAFPTAGSWTLQLTVDGADAQTSSPVTVPITVLAPPGPAGVIDLPASAVNINAGEQVVFAGSATGGGGGPYTYAWTVTPSGHGVTIDQVEDPGAVVFPNRNIVGSPGVIAPWVVTLTVSDNNSPPLVDPSPPTIEVWVLNRLPIAVAGADQVINLGATAQLDASGSIDPDGDTLTYVWSITSQPVGAAGSFDDNTLVNAVFTPDLPGDYVLGLIVHDGFVSSDSVAMTVTVQVGPTIFADAGPDQTVHVGSLVALDGTDSLNYTSVLWEFLSNPAGSLAALTDDDSATTDFLADLPGTYTLRLTVSDSASPINSAIDTITIIADQLLAIAPMFVAASRPSTVPGNRRKAGVPASSIELWKYPKDLYDVAVDWEEDDVLPAGATALGSLTVVVKDSGGGDVTSSLVVSSGVEGFVSWAQLQAGTAGQVYDVIMTQVFSNGQSLDRYVKIQVRDPRAYVVHAPFKYPDDKYPIPIEWAGRRPRGNPALSTLITKAYDAVDADETSTYIAGSFVTGTIGAGYVIGGTGAESRLLEFAQQFSNGRTFHEYAMLTVEVPPA